MACGESPSFTLDSHELRFLSVLKPMTFLMAAEFDLFLAASSARGAPLTLRFPALPVEYRRAVALCAKRFNLGTDPAMPADNEPAATVPITVQGTAKLPLLRYADFLPGRLHVDEVLSVTKLKFSRTEPTATKGAAKNSHDYTACCADYTASYEKDDPKFEAGSFFQTIDLGLPLATMAHLIRFEVAKIATAADAVKSFQRFSHWQKFDLRWDDEDVKRTAIIVMPSTVDVHDIFDRYEDEAVDDNATLLFRLYPVAPCTHVPYLEDALIRRVRDQQWDEIKKLWADDARYCPAPTLVVSNLSAHGALPDLLGPFGAKDVVADASLVMDDGPHKRRKLYLNFTTADAARAALALDGQRVAGLPGKPVVRVQVAPPFVSATRRGSVLSTLRSPSRSPSPQAGPVSPPPQDSGRPSKKGSKTTEAVAGSSGVKADAKGTKGQEPKREKASKSRSPQAAPAAPPADAAATKKDAAAKPSAAMNPKKVKTSSADDASAAKKNAQQHEDPAGDMTSPEPSSEPPMQREGTARPEEATKLNSAAQPFVPRMSPPASFSAPPNGSFSGPPPPPPSYNATPLAGAAVPPPPPPPYGQSPAAGPAAAYGMPPPPPYLPGGTPITAGAPAPPPPPYLPAPGGTPITAVSPAPPPYGAPPPPYGGGAVPPMYMGDKGMGSSQPSSSEDLKPSQSTETS